MELQKIKGTMEMYFILEQLYNNLETVLALTFSLIAVVCYFLFRSIRKDIKSMRQDWDPDKYRKF